MSSTVVLQNTLKCCSTRWCLYRPSIKARGLTLKHNSLKVFMWAAEIIRFRYPAFWWLHRAGIESGGGSPGDMGYVPQVSLLSNIWSGTGSCSAHNQNPTKCLWLNFKRHVVPPSGMWNVSGKRHGPSELWELTKRSGPWRLSPRPGPGLRLKEWAGSRT